MEADARAIADVHVRSWDAAYRGLLPDEVIRSVAGRRRSWWESYLRGARAGDHVLVALDAGRAIGFAAARPSLDADAEPRQAEVSGLYVDPESWGRGAGGALLARIVERLRADGYASATLWVLAANGDARRFYEARGWAPDGAERVDAARGVTELRYRIAL